MLKRWKAENNTHIDGVVRFYTDATASTSFGAARNATTFADIAAVASAPFAALSTRVQDVDWANERGIALSRKIKNRRIPGIKAGMKAVINSLMYDISYIDYSPTEMYVYLEGEREIDT